MVWNTVLAAASVTLTGRKRDTAYRVKREVVGGGGGKGFSKASLQFKKWPLATEAKLTASVKTLSPEINCMHPGGQRNFSNVFPLPHYNFPISQNCRKQVRKQGVLEVTVSHRELWPGYLFFLFIFFLNNLSLSESN